MKTINVRRIRKAMSKVQDAKRFEHTLGVAYTATALAMCHGVSVKSAELAGLLHDCAKCLTDEKRLSICEKHNISMSDIEQRNPFLLHAKVGGYLAMKKYYIRDMDIINAILNHTTGRPNMSDLEKIIFIADYIEPNRKNAPNLTVIRQLAFKDLNSAMKMILEDTLQYLESLNGEIDPMTRKTYQYYQEITRNEGRDSHE